MYITKLEQCVKSVRPVIELHEIRKEKKSFKQECRNCGGLITYGNFEYKNICWNCFKFMVNKIKNSIPHMRDKNIIDFMSNELANQYGEIY